MNANSTLKQFKKLGKYAHIHLDIFDGIFQPAA